MKFAFAFFVALSLTACGTEIDSVGGGAIAKSLLTSTSGALKAPASGSLGLTRASLEQVVTPVLLATLDSRGQQALLGEVQTNQGVATWSTLDDVTISFRNGVIVATRGLGNDLMASDGAAVAKGGGARSRAYIHLSGDDRSVRRVFNCTMASRGGEIVEIIEISYPTTRISERCAADEWAFQNDYWFSTDGKLRKSRQWISEDVGYLTIEDLRR